MRIWKRIQWGLMIGICGVVMWVAAPTTAAAEGMAYRELPVGVTVRIDERDTTTVGVDITPGECLRVELLAAGGTGYDWVIDNTALQLLEVKYHTEAPVMHANGLTGGPVRTVFILQAKEGVRGKETVVFSLRRPWEPAGMAAKHVYCDVRVRNGASMPAAAM